MADKQLSFDDLQELPELRGLERLGSSIAFGEQLLEVLRVHGWDVVKTTALGGGCLVIAGKNGYEIRRKGETFSAIATEVFDEASRIQGQRLAA